MSAWQPPDDAQPQWHAGPPPAPWPAPSAPPAAVPPPPAAPRPVWPLPPAAVWAAGALAVAGAVLLVVLLAVGSVTDVLAAANLAREDASVLGGLLGTLAAAGLLAGAASVLSGRGSGLLRAAGVAVAVLAVLAVVAAAIVQGRVDVPALVFGLVVTAVAAGAAGLTAAPSTAAWTAAAERRSAERAIGRLTGPRAVPLPARGAASLVASLVLVVGVVLAGVLTTSALAPDVAGAQEAAVVPVDGAAPIPVARGDVEYEPALDQLARECAGGDLGSCDRLYLESDLFSEYEEYGSTCGGRTGTEYAGDCAERFD
ncbi:hypothetical protein [Geodermatophilus sp. SYSU D00815]